jgi:hypothetical protein
MKDSREEEIRGARKGIGDVANWLMVEQLVKLSVTGETESGVDKGTFAVRWIAMRFVVSGVRLLLLVLR